MPTRPNRLRHFVNYHNPDVMHGDFRIVNRFAIWTNKVVRDVEGDVVWMIGRAEDTTDYYLYGRFKAGGVRSADDDFFAYEVWGSGGEWFAPPIYLSDQVWFHALMDQTAHFSTGFQSVKDEGIIHALQESRVAATRTGEMRAAT